MQKSQNAPIRIALICCLVISIFVLGCSIFGLPGKTAKTSLVKNPAANQSNSNGKPSQNKKDAAAVTQQSVSFTSGSVMANDSLASNPADGGANAPADNSGSGNPPSSDEPTPTPVTFSFAYWPAGNPGLVTMEYGYRVHPVYGDIRFHYGIDIDVAEGTTVRAPLSGTVLYVGWDDAVGNIVEIDHGGGVKTRYTNLLTYGIHIVEGDTVLAGQQIAMSGNTGYSSTGAHLHFEVYDYSESNNDWVPPYNTFQRLYTIDPMAPLSSAEWDDGSSGHHPGDWLYEVIPGLAGYFGEYAPGEYSDHGPAGHGVWLGGDAYDLMCGDDVPVYAAHNGTVTEIGYGRGGWTVISGEGYETCYAHADPLTFVGQFVSAGTHIATTGSGFAHLHFELIDNGDGVPAGDYPRYF